MPPRREPPVGITMEQAAELFTKQLNDMMPNLVTQIAQVIQGGGGEGSNHTPPGDGDNGGGGGDGGAPEVPVPPQRRCTFKTFTSCNPPKFKGDEGAVGLLSWFESMEAVLYHSECEEAKQVEYASSQFQSTARTWWNNVVQIRGRAAAYRLSWDELRDLMREKFCAKDAIIELEQEFWNLQMNGYEVEKYITRFNELARLVPYLVTPESKRIDRFIYGLIPEVRRGVTTANPTTMQSAAILAKRLTKDVARSSEKPKAATDTGKRKVEGTSGSRNAGNQNKKGRVVRNFAVTAPETQVQGYVGNYPKCDK